MVQIDAPLEDVLEAQSQLIFYLACALHANDVLPLSDLANGIRKETKTAVVSDNAKRVLLVFAAEMESMATRSAPTFTVIEGGKKEDPGPDDNGSA